VIIDGIEVAKNVDEIKVQNLVSSPEVIKELHDNKCEDQALNDFLELENKIISDEA